ncbi:MAG: putative Ig domain-containing protein, partial [Burkholderiales bacterium]
LTLGWGDGKLLRIALASSDDLIGTGIERFRFADGTTVRLAEMLARTGLVPLLTITGTENDEFLVGTFESERILGLAGNDELVGLEGNDELDGGPGNDFLQGGVGNDTYFFESGDGVDYVFDEAGTDSVRFGSSITPQDVGVTNDPYGTLYLMPGSGDRVLLLDWFNDQSPQVESVQFSDGTIWDATELQSRVATLSATEFGDILTETDNNDTVDGLGGNDEIYGLGGNDVLEGGAGDDFLEGGAGNDIVRGGDGADGQSDWQGNNFLEGGAGDDGIYADGTPNYPDGGTNFVVGGAGDDSIGSYAAGNVIAFNPGEGHDTVYAANALTLSLGGGVNPAALSLSQDGTDLVLAIGPNDSIRLTRQFELDPEAWPQITLQTFGSVHLYDFNAVIADFQAAIAADPSLVDFSLDRVLQAHEASVSETDAFGGALAYQYGTAGNVIALSDGAIHHVLAEANFGTAPQSIAMAGGNQVPVLGVPIAGQTAQEDSAFSFVLPAGTFADADAGDALTFSAGLADGSPLPGWLRFDGTTQSFSGTPANEEVGTVSVKVTATDTGNLSVFGTFDVTVANTHDAPTVANAMSDQNATEDTAFSFTVPTNTFADVDAGDTLTYSATLADGSALPAWLTFNAATQTFGGTPANEDVRTVGVRVTATDGASASVSDVFDLTVANTNDTPVLGQVITDQSLRVGVAFDFTLPTDAFRDIDQGDALAYSATLASGDALPAWLGFESTSRTFSGTPVPGDFGTLSIRVTATDRAGASAMDEFQLVVSDGDGRHEGNLVETDHNDHRGHDHGKHDDEHHGRSVGRKRTDHDDDRSTRKGDQMADCLATYFESKPRYDFESLAQDLERLERRGEALSAREIARRWQVVGRYAGALSNEHDEDARGAGYRIDNHGVLGGDAFGGAFGHPPSIGVLHRAVNLHTLQGLKEGLQRLHA